MFANTSYTSACLVVVIKFCATSIPIPNKTEKRNENSNGFIELFEANLLLKNKKLKVVNTK